MSSGATQTPELRAPPSSVSFFHLLVEEFRRNRNAKTTPKYEDTQVFVCAPKVPCSERPAMEPLMLLPTEHSPSPSPLMPQARGRPSRRPSLLTRRQSCPIAPGKSRSRDVPSSHRATPYRTLKTASVSTACWSDLPDRVTPAGDSCRSLPAPPQSRETAPALWSLPRAASISSRCCLGGGGLHVVCALHLTASISVISRHRWSTLSAPHRIDLF